MQAIGSLLTKSTRSKNLFRNFSRSSHEFPSTCINCLWYLKYYKKVSECYADAIESCP